MGCPIFFAPLFRGAAKSLAERYTMEQNGTDSPDDALESLTPNQLAALPYLVAAPTKAECARLAPRP